MSNDHLLELANDMAAQCWMDSEVAGIVVDPLLHKAVAKRFYTSLLAQKQYADGCEFYRNIIHKACDNLGPLVQNAYTSDDGSVQDSPLAIKLPDLVFELVKMLGAYDD